MGCNLFNLGKSGPTVLNSETEAALDKGGQVMCPRMHQFQVYYKSRLVK